MIVLKHFSKSWLFQVLRISCETNITTISTSSTVSICQQMLHRGTFNIFLAESRLFLSKQSLTLTSEPAPDMMSSDVDHVASVNTAFVFKIWPAIGTVWISLQECNCVNILCINFFNPTNMHEKCRCLSLVFCRFALRWSSWWCASLLFNCLTPNVEIFLLPISYFSSIHQLYL